MISLHGKRVLVTGSTRGLGFAVAQVCASLGAKVVLHGRDKAKAEAAAAKLAQAGTPAAGTVAFDLADAEATKAGGREALTLLGGGMDGFVHAAGVLEPALFPMTTLAQAQTALRVNAEAGFQLAQLAARAMERNENPPGGSVVFFSSVMAKQPDRGLAAYAMSKGAVESLTLALARELARKRIRVNAVAPGLADTDMARGAGEKVLAERLARVPMGVMTAPEEIGRISAFLLSDAAPTLTGQILGVDGGMAP